MKIVGEVLASEAADEAVCNEDEDGGVRSRSMKVR